MKWADVVSCISMAAPTLGSLFGPAGTAVGAVVGSGVKLVASALGVTPTQDAVTQAIITDPAAAEKLREFELNNKLEIQKLFVSLEIVKVQEDTKVIQSVNTTMQTENKADHWVVFSWRPFWGFASGTAFFVVCLLISIIIGMAIYNKDSTALGSLPIIIGAFSTLFAIPGAILGIASYKRGDMQIEQAKLGNSVDNKSQDK